jgi:endo-alpha-1,4-polygalactosaminidase (GH114 family)
MEKTSQKNIKTERFVLSMAQSDLVAQDSRSASTRNPQPVEYLKIVSQKGKFVYPNK